MPKSVVVGVDGSEQSVAAAHYAAAMARRHQAPLRLIYVFESLVYGFGPMFAAGSYGVADEQLREAGEEALRDVTEQIRTAHPDVDVTAETRVGGAAAALIAESEQADVTVVGSRGVGGFAELLLGSVSTQVASHGHGAVVVARPEATHGGPVLVGYDGSEHSTAALGFAVREALSLGVPLVVAHTYWPEPWGFGDPPADDPDLTAARQAEQLIEQAVAPHQTRHPDLRVEARAVRSLNPQHTLVEESAHAALTVVGSRGRGGITGRLLGSVSLGLVHHAAGPLAVVHHDRGRDDARQSG